MFFLKYENKTIRIFSDQDFSSTVEEDETKIQNWI